ncbi:beta-ketoacyl-ACP synthase III [Alkalibaculum bacchi]|uniref:beta-ketoacyl-ACP synthase III n=1 Tax=Alkalibaculum bacchi TaxID=645887 RepID=UPI003BFA6BF2
MLSKIIATGKYAPQLAVSNLDLEKIIDTSDDWIYTRTGIRKRRISQSESTLDLTYKAALNAIEKNNINIDTIDLIIVATVTPDHFMPSTACLLQSKLGIDHLQVTSFDINAACTGLIYGIQIADKFISSRSHKRALIVGAETFSKVLDWEDRGTCVLFGDGAGAVILDGEEDKILSDYTNSSGDKLLHLTLPAVPLENPFGAEKKEISRYLTMNGSEIFKFATFAIKDSIDFVLEQCNLNIDDIAYIVPHQANQRIIAKVARVMKIPLDKFYMNVEHYGNTSAASIGIALDDLYETKNLKSGDKIILVGFGGGLTWGSILYEY